MRWPFSRRAESRESYTDREVNAAVAAAEGQTQTVALAAIEACAGLWERAFSAAQSPVLTRSQLGVIGRSLLLHGESVWLVEGGRLSAGASTFTVRGASPDPNAWHYRLTIPVPGRSLTPDRSGRDVFHPRIAVDRKVPYRGCSPLANASGTRAILAALETSMAQEGATPTGQILPVPESRASDADLAADVRNLKGRAVLGETMSGGWGEGRGAAPTRDWQAQRLGPQFTPDEVQVRTDVERSVLAAAGVPIGLVTPTSGADAREDWRRFLASTIGPVAAVVTAELERVGLDGTLDFAALQASDLGGRARAYGQLRKAEMDEGDAKRICGF